MDQAGAPRSRYVRGQLRPKENRMVLTILAASLVALLLISTSVFVARVSRIDDQQLRELELRREDLEQLLEFNRVRSRGW